MPDENREARGKAVYETMCAAFDERNWKYKRFDDDLVITTGFQGDDFPMDFVVRVDAGRELVSVISEMPFKTPPEKLIEIAIAVCAVNNVLVDGSFDLNVKDGKMFFRLTSSYIDSVPGPDVFTYMLDISVGTVDDYNDKFMMLAKGMITLEKFMELHNQD